MQGKDMPNSSENILKQLLKNNKKSLCFLVFYFVFCNFAL